MYVLLDVAKSASCLAACELFCFHFCSRFYFAILQYQSLLFIALELYLIAHCYHYCGRTHFLHLPGQHGQNSNAAFDVAE